MKTVTYEEAQQPDETSSRFWAGIGSLFRQDPARKTLRYSIPIAVAVGSVIRLMAGVIPEDALSLPLSGHPKHVVPLLVQFWIFNLFGVIVAHFNSRCSRLSLGLPVAPRKLWLVRIVSVIAAGVIPVAVVFFIIAQGQQMFASALNGEVLLSGARIVAGVILAVVMYQIPSPGLYRISGGRWYVLYIVVVSIGVLWYSIFTPQSWVFTVAPLVTALVVGGGIYAALPSGFAVIGAKLAATPPYREEDTIGARAAREALGRRGNISWRLNVTVWRSLLNTWVGWTMLLLLAVFGLGLTYYYYNDFHDAAESILPLLWFWILLCHSIKRLHNIDPLPVPRKLPLAHVMITGLLVMMMGSATVTLSYQFGNGPPAAVSVCEGGVCVPPEFWEVTRAEEPPTVTTPWGESHTPQAFPLVRGGKLAVYNPYEFHDDASPEFVEYQIDRAMARVHDLDATAVEAASDTPLPENFTETLDAGEIEVPASAGRSSPIRSGILAVTVAVMSLLFAVLNTVWFRRYRGSEHVRITRWFAILFFSLPQVLMVALAILEVRMNVDGSGVVKVPGILVRRAVEALSVGPAALWTITAVVIIASYVVIQRQYEKVEAPPKKAGKHLLSEY